MTIFRVVQEFVNNAITHGGATKIGMNFNASKSEINILLTDNGRGFDLNVPTTGIGLINIRTRISAYNGETRFTSAKGAGTNLSISILINDPLPV